MGGWQGTPVPSWAPLHHCLHSEGPRPPPWCPEEPRAHPHKGRGWPREAAAGTNSPASQRPEAEFIVAHAAARGVVRGQLRRAPFSRPIRPDPSGSFGPDPSGQRARRLVRTRELCHFCPHPISRKTDTCPPHAPRPQGAGPQGVGGSRRRSAGLGNAPCPATRVPAAPRLPRGPRPGGWQNCPHDPRGLRGFGGHCGTGRGHFPNRVWVKFLWVTRPWFLCQTDTWSHWGNRGSRSHCPW